MTSEERVAFCWYRYALDALINVERLLKGNEPQRALEYVKQYLDGQSCLKQERGVALF